MAIARGAGTEIIRSIHLNDVDTSATNLIYGVQHHVYTVLSIICFASAVQTAGNFVHCYILGYDALQGTTGQVINVFKEDMSVNQTYVWNDKFSFNGTEPTDFTGPLSTAAHQDAIADQATSTRQILKIVSEQANDNFQVHFTYLDQNNA